MCRCLASRCSQRYSDGDHNEVLGDLLHVGMVFSSTSDAQQGKQTQPLQRQVILVYALDVSWQIWTGYQGNDSVILPRSSILVLLIFHQSPLN